MMTNASAGGAPSRTDNTVPLAKARNYLALIWFALSGLFMLILIAQSIGGAYGDELQWAWGWALPNFLPTSALMVSVFASEALLPRCGRAPTVRRDFLTLSIALSGFYLLALLASVLVQPFLDADGLDLVSKRIELLEISNMWLGPLQGLVVTALGVLFFLKDEGVAHGVPGAQP